jgi:Peroxidase
MKFLHFLVLAFASPTFAQRRRIQSDIFETDLSPSKSSLPSHAPSDEPSISVEPSQGPSEKPVSAPAPAIFDPNTPRATLNAARDAMIEIVNSNKLLAYKFVRLGFHDCVGGCDGCVDLLDPDNKGLDIPITALEGVVANFTKNGITRADIWAYAAMLYADMNKAEEGVEFLFEFYGRPTCEMLNNRCFNSSNIEVPCSPTQGPFRVMPSPNLDTRGILAYFDKTFGLNAQETVALMGAHSIGTVTQTNSGFNGDGWDSDKGFLDNDYYKKLVGGNSSAAKLSDLVNVAPIWNRRKIINTGTGILNRFQWSQNGKVMLNADMALVRDFSGRIGPNGKVVCTFRGQFACPAATQTIRLVAAYRNDQNLWMNDFRDVFTDMLNYPYITGGGCPGVNLCLITTFPKHPSQ